MPKKKDKEYVLLKDIVIPAGTRLSQAPTRTERNDEHFDCVIGLSPNTSGTFTYCVDKDYAEELLDHIAPLI